MGGTCVAYNCNSKISKKIPGRTFHRFPKDEYRCKLWVQAIRREKLIPTPHSVLCSKHFAEEMIDRTSLSCVRLREHAVPTIFDFPPHLQKMTSCSAYNCTSRFTKNEPGITFHIFPKDEKRRDLWIKAVRRKNWIPSKFSKLCSKHFQEDDFDRTSLSCVRLRDHAVPSIFVGFPKYLQKIDKSRKPSSKSILKTVEAPTPDSMKFTPKKLNKKANPSKKSCLSSDKIIEQASTEMNQVFSPSIPKVMAVWSCSNNKTDNNLAIINDEISNLPSYMKQALMAKAAIDKTYEDTSDAVASNFAKNNHLFPHPIVNIPATENGHKNTTNLSCIVPTNSAANPLVNNTVFIPATENGHKNITNLSYIVPTNSAANPIVNNTVLIPVTENGPKNITNLSYIVPTNILLSTVTEKVCDASTSTDFQDIVPKLKIQLERAEERNERLAKSNKTVLQRFSRCQKSLKRVKHSIFCELLDRRYMSNNADFNIDKEGCLFDRDSIRLCESTDSESEEDELLPN